MKCCRIIKTLADLFIEESLISELSTIQGTKEFATEQLEEYSQKLRDSEEVLRLHRQNLARTSNQVSKVNINNLDHVNSLVQSFESEKLKKIDDLNLVESRLGNLGSELHLRQTDRMTSIKAELIEKISKHAELLISFPWNSGDVIRLGKEITEARRQLIREIRQNGSQDLHGNYGRSIIELVITREIIETEISLLNQRIHTLNRLIELFNRKRNTIPVQELKLSNYEAQVEKNRQLYQTFVDQANSARIREAMQRTEMQVRYRILDPPQIPVTPINADKTQIILIAALLGLGLAGGLVYLLEFLDNSYKSIDDIETTLGVSVLGIVPNMDFGQGKSKKKKWAFSLFTIFSSLIMIALFFIIEMSNHG